MKPTLTAAALLGLSALPALAHPAGTVHLHNTDATALLAGISLCVLASGSAVLVHIRAQGRRK
jgi:hypothetical protein